MIENTQSLLPNKEQIKAFTLGVEDESLNELDRLLHTLGVETAQRVMAPVRKVVAGTYFGTGKLDEVREQGNDIDLFVIDVELTPRQMQNIEKILGKPVLDRNAIILEIFQRGGGVGNKGMGEKQIEVDRRLVKRRISILQGRLKEIEKERKVQRASRQDIMKAAIVGYTNAGKSTLLNSLTESKVLAEDKLFATLDSTVRSLNPDSHPPVVVIDTVGFIQKIPTSLIASFRSTLEEIAQADLIVHVVDASSVHAREQYETTVEVLNDLKCGDKERLVVLNKMDLLSTPSEVNRAKVVYPGAVRISALDVDAVKRLRDQILDHFKTKMQVFEVVVPYTEGKLLAKIQEHGAINSTKYLEKGVFMQVKMDTAIANKLGVTRYATSKKD